MGQGQLLLIMKKLRFLICAILGVASAILSFSAHSEVTYSPLVTTYYCGSNCTSYNSPATSTTSTSLACSTYAANLGGLSPHYIDYYGPACAANHPNGTVNYWIGALSVTSGCPDGFVSNPAGSGATACYMETPPDPCEENEGVQSSSTFYQGDTSSSGGGGAPYVPPSVVCLAECRSVFSGADECYSRAYLPGDPKFGQHAVFCKANYIGIAAQCETGDATSAGNASPSAPDPAANPPAPEAPDCPAGTYAVKSGSQWICNSQDAPHPSPDEEGCPPGTSPGTMNGQTVCAPASGNQNTAPTGSGTPGSGGANGSGNGSGSGSTGAGGEGAGAQGATADTGGAVGGSADIKGVGQTSVGVDCGTAPICSGDPLLCGIQLQEFESACAVQNVIGSPLPEDELEKWQAVGVEVDSPAVDTALSRASQKLDDFSSRLSFQTSGCPADFSISVMGRSIPIAISSACSLLQLMKMILFMGAYLFSLRVLWSSVL